MQRSFLWLFLSLVLLGPSASYAQFTQRKALSGHIREEGSGQLISEARIELQNSFGTPITTVLSDRTGSYEFDDIGGGDCYLSVQHDGYAAVREFVRPDGSSHVYKDIFLRLTGSASIPKTVNPVSEHELSVPQKARDSFEKGVQLIAQKSDYRAAIVQFNRAISQFPSYYEAYAAMGLAQSKMGDATAAEVSLRRSVDMSQEKYPQAMIDLAALFNAKNRFSEAEPLLRKALVLDASSWRTQDELAVALAGEKRYTDAVASASAARDLKPENPQNYLLLYNLHIQTENYTAALADTDAYLKLAPDGPLSDKIRKLREQLLKDKPADAKQ
jgi:hypothetical protein